MVVGEQNGDVFVGGVRLLVMLHDALKQGFFDTFIDCPASKSYQLLFELHFKFAERK